SADLSVEPYPASAVRESDLVAFYLPMHTATHLSVPLIERSKEMNPNAHICAYGLYAPMNEFYLRQLGCRTVLGGEFEEGLLNLCRRLRMNAAADGPEEQIEPLISTSKQNFYTPERSGLPELSNYARLCNGSSLSKITGYTEASHGCKHLCRHCPVVPVYNGRFRVVQREVVLADIRQQVEAGAQHITFGDPDFFNGPGHAIPIVQALHKDFPEITYDVTIKIEHLLRYRKLLPVLRDTGCAIITSAVESIDDTVLAIFDKGHTRADFIKVVKIFNELGLVLNPTFIPFTPWTTMVGYRELLMLIHELGLVEHVSPIQLAIRLLIPRGSKLLELAEVRTVIGDYNPQKLSYEWCNADPAVEELYHRVISIVRNSNTANLPRRDIFKKIWNELSLLTGQSVPLPESTSGSHRACIPYLNEPWYC
ncbi:MAG: CUAEP/CCAEP-tail radical SAM (seleno)protein, partial [Calditrichia bacterium]